MPSAEDCAGEAQVVVACGVARIDVREIFDDVVVYAMLWFVIGVSIFTFVK